MNRSLRDQQETPAKRGFHGDGGNRTHALFPPSQAGAKPVECRDKAAPHRVNDRGLGTGGATPMHDQPIRLPLRDRSGRITAYALIDQADAHLAQHQWSIDARTSIRTGPPYIRRGGRTNGVRWTVALHREVLGLGASDSRKVDHRNGDTFDNRRSNLRVATVAQNAQNQGSRGGSSRFRGVTWDKGRQKWMASGMLDGRRRTIGRFESEDEANAAAMAWRALHMPFSEEAA